jgi:aspartate/methionine/tyrosine aminotransferase
MCLQLEGLSDALRKRRAFFKANGATATDHGHLTALTADLPLHEAERLYQRIFTGKMQPGDVELFQAQMLTEMAGMSVEDGLTMQLHPGSVRNYNKVVYEKFGRDKGATFPSPTEYVRALRPLLSKYGNEPNFTFILFTLDETTFTRELAPLAGHFPSVKLGPPWWFHDSPEGMMRFRETATETAGFYNTVGFNDDTRAFLSIPARHDVARRVDCAFLARLVAEHRLDEAEAFELVQDLTVNLVRKAYTSESYSFLFRLLCDPGDEVLVSQPSYPLFDFLADLDDVRLRPYPLFYDHGWWIDIAKLERAITPRTRAILVVHPNNPTGHWTGGAEREVLEALCARHGLALIVDEVFLDYPLRELESPSRSFASGDHPALTFVLSGLSKIAGLPQMKAAWIAVLGTAGMQAEALGRLEIVADTFLSMNAPVQLAMPGWLAGRSAIQTQILERARGNLATLRRIAEELPGQLQLLEVDAGWSAVLVLPGCVGEPDCAERLVRERGVITHPGSFYGIGEPNRIVVSLIGPGAVFSAGIQHATIEPPAAENLQVMDEPE